MYFLSYMEFRLSAFFTCCNVCVRSVLCCCCYAVLGMTDSIFRFFPLLLQRVGYTHMFVVP